MEAYPRIPTSWKQLSSLGEMIPGGRGGRRRAEDVGEERERVGN